MRDFLLDNFIIFTILCFSCAAIIVGILLGNAAVFVFNKIPPAWLTEYGESPEKELLEQDKNTLEEEKANLQNQNGLLNNQLIDKDKIIQSKENKITELEEEINKLNKKASCCVDYDEIAAIGRTINKLGEDIAKLKDEVKRIKVDLPKDIKIGQWYPETIIKYPTKRQYKNNEYIDLTGMKIRFTKYAKENDEYKVINEEVDYEIFKNETHGWEFKLKTPKAIYNKETSGKMQIKFSFVLKNKEKSME